MKRWGLALLCVLSGAGAASAWVYMHRETLSRQYACHRIGQAANYEAALTEIAWFDAEPDRAAKLRELVGGFGRGSQRFDAFLLRRLDDPDCSDDLRREFSRELGWRTEMLSRWAHYWCWRLSGQPDEELDSIHKFLDTMAQAEPPRPITWRQVLDLQAAMTLTGQAEMARRVSTDEWADRYHLWLETEKDWPKEMQRPELPLPGWKGPTNEFAAVAAVR